jgi:pimeloyl-ACP methyl ester carboxylesterase
MTATSVESTPSSSLTSTLIRLMFRMGSVGTGLIALAAGLLYVKQESLLYFPEIGGIPRRPDSNPRGYRSPTEYNIPFESNMIRCEDGVFVHSWLLLHPNSKAARRPTIVFFHGNAGNIGLRLPNAHQMYSKLNANILMVEYRGYGNSDSVKPTEKGLKLDAEAALNFIAAHPQIDPQRLFCFGRSLGGAVAFHLAKYSQVHRKPLAGIIVENTFLSISSMVDQLMPLVAPFKFLILRMDWGNEKVAPAVKAPVLYLAGDRDELVPHDHMVKLFEYSSKASDYPQMHVIRGGTHNDSWMVGGGEYFVKFKAFMSHVMLNENDRDDNGFSSTSSLDGGVVSTGGSDTVEVTMGQDGTVGIGLEKNAIPVMPNNFVGIAKEATKASSSADTNASDKKKS